MDLRLPQFLNKGNSMLPELEEAAGPRALEISMRNPFRDFQRPGMSLPEMPRMVQSSFRQNKEDIEPIIEEALYGDDDKELIGESFFVKKE